MKLYELKGDRSLFFYHPKIGESMSVKDAKKLFKGAVNFVQKVAADMGKVEFDIDEWIHNTTKADLINKFGFKEAKVTFTMGI